MTNPIAPPPAKKKVTNFSPPLFNLPSISSFSSLPDEIVVNFLARISKAEYRSLCSVSKSFYSLLSSPGIYADRSQIGATEPRLYVCLRSPTPNNHCWFTLVEGGELSLAPVRFSSSYAPARLNSTSVTVGFEIYQIGGTVNKKLSKAVSVLDCRSHTWRCAPSLTVARKCAKSCFLDGKIYVIGGDEEESLIWGEVFDIKTQTWTPLASPSTSINNVNADDIVVVLGGRMHLITKHNNYAYDPKQGIWLPVPDDVGPRITGTGPGPCCCVIDNVMFSVFGNKCMWYNSSRGKWSMVCDLFGLFTCDYQKIQLVNYGRKLVVIWHQRFKVLDAQRQRYIFSQDKRIWCAVVRLEKRFTSCVLGLQTWGVIESRNVVLTVPRSSKLLSCLSVSV